MRFAKMTTKLSIAPDQKKEHQEERQKRMDEILKKQSERNVLRPAGSRKYRKWSEVELDHTNRSRTWF